MQQISHNTAQVRFTSLGVSWRRRRLWKVHGGQLIVWVGYLRRWVMVLCIVQIWISCLHALLIGIVVTVAIAMPHEPILVLVIICLASCCRFP